MTPPRTSATSAAAAGAAALAGVLASAAAPTPVPISAERGLLSAGALVWRLRHGILEVLLVHRPRYRDWSWPKGKVDPGEPMGAAAVREVFEETGETVVLGRPLPTVSYKVSAGLKKVLYWEARAVTPSVASPELMAAIASRPTAHPASTDEIDSTAWMSAADAARALTRSDDLVPLRALLDAYADGQLTARRLIIARHAKAVKRSAWSARGTGREHDRPLTPVGSAQSERLVNLVAPWAPTLVVTSPWERCLATVDPYVVASDAEVRLASELTEAGAAENPGRARQVLRDLVNAPLPRAVPNMERIRAGHPPVTATGDLHWPMAETTLVCTHRPVLPMVQEILAAHAIPEVLRALPFQDPYLKPGEVLILSLAPDAVGAVRVVAMERTRP